MIGELSRGEEAGNIGGIGEEGGPTVEKRFAQIGLAAADILLPAAEEMEKWAVVACDQFTSQPEYWAEAERIAGLAMSLEQGGAS